MLRPWDTLYLALVPFSAASIFGIYQETGLVQERAGRLRMQRCAIRQREPRDVSKIADLPGGQTRVSWGGGSPLRRTWRMTGDLGASAASFERQNDEA
jgi:hypothetical protein